MITEKMIRGEPLSGRGVAELEYRTQIFVNGKHSIVVEVNVRGNNVELVYVKGRKAFGKEQYLDLKLSDRTTPVMLATPGNPDEWPVPYAGESIAESMIDTVLGASTSGDSRQILESIENIATQLNEGTRKDLEARLSTKFSQMELRKLAAMLLTLVG